MQDYINDERVSLKVFLWTNMCLKNYISNENISIRPFKVLQSIVTFAFVQ